MFQFQKDLLKTKEKLGKGRFGSVFPYQKHSEDLKWVVKRIKVEDADALVSFLPEVVLGMSCDHPNVVPVKGYYIEKISGDEGYNIYTKLPRMKETLLENFKQRKGENKPFSEEEIISYFYSLVCGVEYLHRKRIFHGDIKPESLLLDHNGMLHIGDIGISKHIVGEKRLVDFQYSAPETLGIDIKKEMLRKADIWSLGVVILELCSFDLKLLNVSLPKDKLQERLNELFASLQEKYQSLIISLLLRMLSLDPEQRPDIGQIKNELENSFSDILAKSNHNKNIQSQSQKKISDEQKQEMFGKYEAEIKHLKGVISQFESELTKKTIEFEEQIRKFEEEKAKIIKDCDDSLMQEFEKRMQLHERFKYLEAQVEISKKSKRESYEKDYDINLQKVVSQLNEKWNKWYKLVTFECKVEGNNLRIHSSIKYPIKDNDLIIFLQDLLPALEENNLLNLSGIMFVIVMTDVTDRSIVEFASIISHESLKLQYLDLLFLRCQKLTDQSFEDLSKAIAARSLYLQHLNLTFDKCNGLTDKSLDSLANGLSSPSLSLKFLELSFESVKGMTDSGFENLTKAIENRNLHSQSMSTLGLIFTEVTVEKKMQAKRRFENIAALEIK